MRAWKLACVIVVTALMAAGSSGCTELTNSHEITIVKDLPKPPPAPVAAPAQADGQPGTAAARGIRQAAQRPPSTGCGN